MAIINALIKIFESFDEQEKYSNPYNKYTAQLPPESKDFTAWRTEHEDFNRTQRFCEFLKNNPDLIEMLAYSLLEYDNVIDGLTTVVCNNLQRTFGNLSLKGGI